MKRNARNVTPVGYRKEIHTGIDNYLQRLIDLLICEYHDTSIFHRNMYLLKNPFQIHTKYV